MCSTRRCGMLCSGNPVGITPGNASLRIVSVANFPSFPTRLSCARTVRPDGEARRKG